MIRLILLSLVAAWLLFADALSAASLTIRWTSPGDDGTVGTARTYDIRFSIAPITLDNWSAASQVTGEPSPQLAGTRQQFTIPNLEAGESYYVAIRTADEANNWSGLSNVIRRKVCGGFCTGRGNIDGSDDGMVTLLDLMHLIQYLSNGPLAGEVCPDNANVDGSADGNVNILDIAALTQYLTGNYEIKPCQ